jgi:hypothetical protein
MGYHSPTFNLTANVWHVLGPIIIPPIAPPSLTTVCQLRMYKTAFEVVGFGFTTGAVVALLVPKGTDLRPELGFLVGLSAPDLVECPAGSGRYYRVRAVEDVAKGFGNEYRQALLIQVQYVGTPPIP